MAAGDCRLLGPPQDCIAIRQIIGYKIPPYCHGGHIGMPKFVRLVATCTLRMRSYYMTLRLCIRRLWSIDGDKVQCYSLTAVLAMVQLSHMNISVLLHMNTSDR